MIHRAPRLAALLAAMGSAACSRPHRTPMHTQVEIRALAFQTAALRVALGDTVTWTNQEIVPHTVTSDGPDASLQSPMLVRDSTFTWVAKAIGTVRYHCQYHPSMIATVEVVP